MLGGVVSVSNRAITHDLYGSRFPPHVLNPNCKAFIPRVGGGNGAPDTICTVPAEFFFNPECEVFIPRDVCKAPDNLEASPLCGSLALGAMGMSKLNPLCTPFVPGRGRGQQVVVEETGVGGLQQAPSLIDPLSTDTPGLGPVDRDLLFSIDGNQDIPEVCVYSDCLVGTCTCTHFIGSEISQLKPCRFAPFISGAGNVFPGRPDEAKFIWEGINRGFKIVDDDCDTSYTCSNYKTILEPQFYSEMCEIIRQEIQDGYITRVPMVN